MKREVERGSTFTLTCDLSYIASILFAIVSFTRQWKSALKFAVQDNVSELTREDKGDREGIPHTHPIP